VSTARQWLNEDDAHAGDDNFPPRH
jgi:hypothetical protein